jgi:hypothetical protein
VISITHGLSASANLKQWRLSAGFALTANVGKPGAFGQDCFSRAVLSAHHRSGSRLSPRKSRQNHSLARRLFALLMKWGVD